MTKQEWEQELRWIQEDGATLSPGLSERQLRAAEKAHGFQFPPDLRSFLSCVLPASPQHPDWREPNSESLREWMADPWLGVAFDIENNAFWWNDWGPRPEELGEALAKAKHHFAQVPRLIPVYGHRFLPSEPLLAGNPVLSVVQTDVIYYGTDLRNYFANEHCKTSEGRVIDLSRRRRIRFWSDLIESPPTDTGPDGCG